MSRGLGIAIALAQKEGWNVQSGSHKSSSGRDGIRWGKFLAHAADARAQLSDLHARECRL